MRAVENEIKIVERRIAEAEERRNYFVKQFEETGKKFYAKMAESETDTILEIRQAIIEALV